LLSSKSFFRVRKNSSLVSSRVKLSSPYQKPIQYPKQSSINSGIFKGNRYSIKTDKGSFNLRDYSHSKAKGISNERWTIDINKGTLGNNKNLEIKFK
jgi:hypothetical protein